MSELKFSSWRVQLGALFVGLLGLIGLALIFANLFSPHPQPAELSEARDALPESHYVLEWQSVVEGTGRQLLADEIVIYSEVLREALSGRLLHADARRVEDQAQAGLHLIPKRADTRRHIRLQSRITPRLVLSNHSLAAFEVETDHLYVQYSSDYSRLLEQRIETVRETIRIADTRLGLSVRHVEATETPYTFSKTKARPVAKFSRLGGFNYYPASAPWNEFWEAFPVDEIAADFKQMRALGANSVRVFANRKAFGEPGRQGVSLRRLERLLDLAHANDLQVILTCFDMGANYELSLLTQSWAHLEHILEIAANHPAVALIDLKNEPDLDYEHWGAPRVDLWLSTLLTLAQKAYPDLNYTIGWSSAEAALALSEQVDIVSFHDFEAPSGLADRIELVRTAAGRKPVMLTEIGHSRWPVFPGRTGQAEKLSAQLDTLSDLEGVLVWTLNDFDRIPNEVAGWRPWRKAMQARYGLSAQSRDRFASFLSGFLKPSDPTHNGDTL